MAATIVTASLPISSNCCASSRSSNRGSNIKPCDVAGSSLSQVSFVTHRCHLVRKAGKLAVSSSRRRVVSTTASATNGRDPEASGPDTGFVPAADFYKVEAIVRPWRLKLVAHSLIQSGIRGVTVTDVRGFGSQGGSRERHVGSEFSEDSFVTKVKLEVVVSKDQVEDVVEAIIDRARTGEIGDGKIFISPVADVIRVRTGERGLKAERMAGGRAELIATKASLGPIS